MKQAPGEYSVLKSRAAARGIDWRDVYYAPNCCKIGELCPMHLELHRSVCAWPVSPCDVCEVQP